MVGVPANPMQSTMQALALTASRKHILRNFKDTFSKVLLNETGITLTFGGVSQEIMDRELQLALRLSDVGDTVDLLSGPPVEGDQVGKWSEDASELLRLVKQLGPRNPNLSSEHFLKPFFRHLALPKLDIRELDDDVTRFAKLTFLDVSRNSLTSIDNIPPNLKYLKAYNNPIGQISCKPTPSLSFLGLGYSKLGADGLEQAARRFKNLLSVDACFSGVSGFQDVVGPLAPLPKLRHLCLTGSPVVLLPFYRLQVLRWLPQLHVLDGVAASEEQQADVQVWASSGTAVRPRPACIRFGIQLKRLSGARYLLENVAEELANTRERNEEIEDDIVVACGGGSLGVHIEMPDGSWLTTQEYRFRSAEELMSIKAASPEDAPEPLDEIFLAGLGTRDHEPLYFDLDVGEEGSEVNGEVLQEDGLLRLCHWLRKGLAVKFFFRPAPPKRSETPLVDAEGGEAEHVEPPLPDEIDLGGTVFCLDSFLSRMGTDVAAEMRSSRSFPESPAPWRLEFPAAKVVRSADYLQPNVQVPSPDTKPVKAVKRTRSAAGAGEEEAFASVSLNLELHAGEPPPLEEEPPPPVLDPKAKAKAKADPKAKK